MTEDNDFIKKVIIPGEYWDSFIYKKWLILICMDGTIKSYNWEKIILDEISDSNDSLAYKCAFLQGNNLYGINSRTLILQDKEFKDLLRQKFKRIRDIEISADKLNKYAAYKKEVVLNNLTTDIGIYKDTFYYCNSDGVFCNALNPRNVNYMSKNSKKLWDGNVQNLQVGKYGTIIMSASSDGLFDLTNNDYIIDYDEYDEYYSSFGGKKIEKNIHQISSKHSSYCSWSFSSVFSGSFIDECYLIATKYEIQNDYKKKLGIIKTENDIFETKNENSYVFSNNDKFYRLSTQKIEKVNFYVKDINVNPFKKKEEKNITFEDEIINSAVTDFGLIVETSRHLLVFLSNEEVINIADNDNEEFITWRTFPRSKCYINQIHIVYNDRIEIVSINSDYFVDQNRKFFGNSYHETK